MTVRHDPPSHYQFALKTAFIVTTLACVCFGILTLLPQPKSVPLYHFLPTVIFSVAMLRLLRFVLRRNMTMTPIVAAWHGTCVGGMIFGMLVLTFMSRRGDWIIAPLLGACFGCMSSMLSGLLGLAVAATANHHTGTRSPLVLGTLCGGTSGFLCLAPFLGELDEALGLAWAAALICGVCSAYGVHVCNTTPRPATKPQSSFALRDEVRCADIATPAETHE